MKPREIFIIISTLLLLLIAGVSILWPSALWSLLIVLPIVIIGWVDLLQRKHTIRRNFPVLGNFRYLLEKIRPEIMQYFVETDTQGRPIHRLFRSLIYQRAKKAIDTNPFGTQMNVYRSGYEWMEHSIYAKNAKDLNQDLRVLIGNEQCKKPYAASILNISAMSFGALSKNAVMAMNKGAKSGNFAQNTGEGGISEYHLKYGGDLIWQIGTGYFGCRKKDGSFCPDTFKEKAQLENVKMIEIKISQGAKPGHGGILPATKNNLEISAIRDVEPFTDVHSPPGHTAFSDAQGLIQFIQQLRELSGGKPIGFKICLGSKEEFRNICEAMISTGIHPDFITVDGGEGGTGAAPVEFSNSLGMPLRDGLSFAVNTLKGYDLKEKVKVIASGKIFTGFHIARAIALGADTVNSARAMMLAVGCIQALQCNQNTCPVGVTTQNKSLVKGLVVNDKFQRVANFHRETIKAFIELMGACGFENPSELKRSSIIRRTGINKVLSYQEIYPEVEVGSYLKKEQLVNNQ